MERISNVPRVRSWHNGQARKPHQLNIRAGGLSQWSHSLCSASCAAGTIRSQFALRPFLQRVCAQTSMVGALLWPVNAEIPLTFSDDLSSPKRRRVGSACGVRARSTTARWLCQEAGWHMNRWDSWGRVCHHRASCLGPLPSLGGSLAKWACC